MSPRIRSNRSGKSAKIAIDDDSHSVIVPIVILMIFVIIITVELTTNFVEKSAGAYLNWRNADREAWGTLWVKEASKRDAARQLDAETAEANRLRRKAELVNSFAELIPIMPSGVGVPITPAKFVELYKKIPTVLQSNLIPSSDLSNLYWSNKIRRASAWVDDDNLVIYLIDSRNRVIRDVVIDKYTFRAVSNYGKTVIGRIENMPVFANFTLSSEDFFHHLYELSQPQQTNRIIDPNALLSVAKPVTQVGIGTKDDDRYGILGFESIGADGYYVITFPVPNEALWEFINTMGLTQELKTETP